MSKDFFNGMAGSWDDMERTPVGKLRRVAAAAGLLPGQLILDVGSGTGNLIPLILEKCPEARVCAMDYAEEMVEAMRNKNFPGNVFLENGDIQRTRFGDEAFDRIIANSCFPHFEDRPKALREIFRLLKPGGIFILSHPDGRQKVNDRHREHRSVAGDILPPAAELGAALEEAGFLCLDITDEEDFYLLKCLKESCQPPHRRENES